MYGEERGARDLARRLEAASLPARVEGQRHRWTVTVPLDDRALEVSCFWYAPSEPGVVLGLNPGNSRRSLRVARTPPSGAEYMVRVVADDAVLARGRTADAAAVVTAAMAWRAAADLDAVHRRAPFVDGARRSMAAVADALAGRWRFDLKGDPTYELWVYGDGRACRFERRDDGGLAGFAMLGQAQVAAVADVGSALDLTALWLDARIPVTALPEQVPGLRLERHVECIEADPAEWHWRHVADRIADPRDVLAPLAPIIERLGQSAIARRFYSFSSLYFFCSSASSHYPWVRSGLPTLAPESLGDVDGAVSAFEAALAACPVEPFFGSMPVYQRPLLAAALARIGSSLRPRVVQREAFFDLRVDAIDGERGCTVSEDSVCFDEAGRRVHTRWPSLEAAASAIERFIARGDALDAVAADAIRSRGRSR